ncbi:MAG: hypothetical protein AB7K37_10535 [Cyclobacteriaceae bacterium]
MLNYSVQVGEFEDDAPHYSEPEGGFGSNPFPGLRPFTLDECHLYFGREGQVDEILLKLSKNRSVTVMGYSGSGKSSLMTCGLIPVLYGGFVTETGPHWQAIAARPGASPIVNLTEAIVDHQIQLGMIDESDRVIHRAIISSVLRSSPEGLVEIARYLQKTSSENIFFLIDQFEELFRNQTDDIEYRNDATTYVNLVLNAVHQTKVPVYVALSMRSDFIGDCAAFTGLTQMINNSNYLVPQMTRDQKRMAVEGPIAVAGGHISNRLVKRLLSDIEDHEDQLPILQHALMRTWDYWVNNHEPGEPMDIRHYNAIGKIDQALSRHANEIFDSLSSREKEIAEVLFKNVTEKGEDSKGTRRPVMVSLVAELAEATDEEVIGVVDQFRKPGRSFLMPDVSVVLDGSSLIELSHESLMRIWTRLSGWVDEEFESAKMYKRISDAAAMYQIGRTSLWRPPDLQLALNWQKKQKPTRSWAQRYDIAFERAIVFLDTSRITYEAELKNQEMLQRRMLRRARVTNVILTIFLLIAIAFFFYGLTQQIQAERAASNAIEQQKLAEAAREVADTERQRAEGEKERAETALKANEELLIQLQASLTETRKARDSAQKLFLIAEEQRRIAIQARDTATLATQEAIKNYNLAVAARNEANRLLYLSVAQSLAAKAATEDDAQLAGLLSMQGYLFHTKYDGKTYDPYIFEGLYAALAKLNGSNYNQLTVPGNIRNKMFALAVAKNSDKFYTTGDDGRIFEGDLIAAKVDNKIGENRFRNRVLALSKEDRYLVNGSDSSQLQIFDLQNPGRPRIVEGHKQFVNAIKFLPDNSGFISASADKTLRFTNQASGNSRQILALPFDLKSIDISSDGKLLAGVSATGEIVLVNLTDNKHEVIANEYPSRPLSVAFHPTKPLIAYGMTVMNNGKEERGLVKLFDLNGRAVTKELGGHRSGISDLVFSPDGQLLASAGLDRKLQMWVVDHVEDLPIQMDNNNGNIWDIAFAKGSDYLIATCNSGEIRVWPTNPRMLAEQVCPRLSRNMTPEEWEIYVANGIEYESTCKSLLISDF